MLQFSHASCLSQERAHGRKLPIKIHSVFVCLPVYQIAQRSTGQVISGGHWHGPIVASHAAGSLDHAARPAAAPSKPGDKMIGRYYQVETQDNPDSPAAAAAAAGGNAAPEIKDAEGLEAGNDQRKAVLKELEQQTLADPGNQDVWLQYALEQIDYGPVDSMKVRCAIWGVFAGDVLLCLCFSLILLVSNASCHCTRLQVTCEGYSAARPNCTDIKTPVISTPAAVNWFPIKPAPCVVGLA